MNALKSRPEALAETIARIAKHARPANEVTRREARAAVRARAAAATRRGVPTSGPVWEAVRDERVAATEAVDALGRALALPGSLVLLSGRAGSGKSVALAWHVLDHRGPALLVSARVLGDALAAAGDADAAELGARAEDVGLLAVDDVVGDLDERAAAALVGLVCARVDLGRATILATTLDEGALRARLFDGPEGRLASRFGARGRFVALPPVDYRQSPAALAAVARR